jgi:hypothetical protein
MILNSLLLDVIFQAGYLLRSPSSTEDGGDILLRNVGFLTADNVALYLRRCKSSHLVFVRK